MYVIIGILAAFSYALMGALIKVASETTNHASILFLRFFTAFLMLLPIYYLSGRPTIKTTKKKLHFIRSLCGFSMFTLFTISLKYLPVENALALNATYPFFIPLILFFLYKEKIKYNTIAGITLGFIGVYFIINPSVNNHLFWASGLALLSAIFSAFANVTMSILRKTDNSFSIIFYFFLFSTIASFLLCLNSIEKLDIKMSYIMLAIAITSILSQQCLAYVLKYLHPTIVSSLMYSSLVFGFLLTWIIWGETPSNYQIIGSILVIIGNLIVIKKKENKRCDVSH